MIVLRLKPSKFFCSIRWSKVLLVGTILVLSCTAAFGQLELRNKVVKYTTHKGLPLKVINSITQRPRSFQWLYLSRF